MSEAHDVETKWRAPHDLVTAGNLRLRPLRVGDEPEARAAHAELEAEGFWFLLGWRPEDSWTEYVQALDDRRHGMLVAADRVPATFLIAEIDAELIGRVSIRHALNAFLSDFGGHIGYAVRPRHRRRGFATEILRQSLIIARSEGVDRVLVTCDDDNLGSARVIERLGGVLEDVRPNGDRTPKRRYWIA